MTDPTPPVTPARRPLLRLLGIVLGVIVLLLVLAVGAVAVLLKPASYQQLLVDAVRERTGRELVLSQPLELALWPCCGLAVEEASLGQPPGFAPAGATGPAAEPFVQVKSARLRIALLTLLRERRLEVSRITLGEPRINLVRRPDGRDNWTFPDDGEETAPAGDDAGREVSIRIAGVDIADGVLRWDDQQAGSRYELSDLDLEVGAVGGDDPVPLETSFRFRDLAEGLDGTFAVSGDVTLDQEAAAGAATTTARIGNFTLDFRATGISESLPSAEGKASAPAATLTLADRTTLDAPALAVDLAAEGPDFPDGRLALKGSLSDVALDVDRGGGTVGGFQATVTVAAIPLEVTGKGRVGLGPEAPDRLSGSVKIPMMSPRDFLARRPGAEPLETADPKALTRLSGSAGWALEGEQLSLAPLALRLDDTALTGSLATGMGENAPWRFDLGLDAIDLDRYLAPEADEAGSTGGGGPGETDNFSEDLAFLKDFTAKGRLRIARLRYAGLSLSDLDVSGNAGGGRLRLEPVKAALYGGRYAGSVDVDATGASPRLRLEQQVADVALGDFLKDYAQLTSIVAKASGTTRLQAAGSNRDELLRSLGGRVDLKLADGVYRGVDLWQEIRKARALIRREPAPPATGPAETRLEAVTLAGPIEGGRFRSEEFLAQVPHLRLSGALALDLPAEQIDGDLVALVYETPTFADGTSLPDLENVRIPLTVRGPVASPKLRPDLQKMVRGAAEQALKEKASSATDRLLKRLEKRLGGGTTETPEAAPAPGGQEAAPGGTPEPPAPEEQKEEEKKKDPLRDALDKLLKGS